MNKIKMIGKNGGQQWYGLNNIFSPGRAGSESDVRDSLLRILEIKTNRILVTSLLLM